MTAKTITFIYPLPIPHHSMSHPYPWRQKTSRRPTLIWGNGGVFDRWKHANISPPICRSISSCLAFSVYTMVSHLYQILMDQWNVTYRTLVNAIMSVSVLLQHLYQVFLIDLVTLGDRNDATACEIFLQYCICWVDSKFLPRWHKCVTWSIYICLAIY